MIIRYRKAEKIGDHAVTSILTIQDADQASLDKVLKYFEPEVSQQELAVSSAPSEPQPKPQKDDIEFNPDMSIKKEAVNEMIVEKLTHKTEAKKEAAPTVLKHPEGKVIKKDDVKHSRPKRLPLLRTNLTEQKPPELDENMRMFGDVVHYRVKAACPSCGNTRDHWSRSYNSFVKCHECGFKIEQEPATPNSLESDKDGYYFHASQTYTETRED